MKKLFLLLLLIPLLSLGQTKLILVGKVVDAKTGAPLSFATVGLKNSVEETISKSDGTFELRVGTEATKDTLAVFYLGYKPWKGAVNSLASMQLVSLEETYTLLSEVVVESKKFNSREIDRAVRPIRGKLYAMPAEVTNAEYNTFLAWLEDHNQSLKQYEFNYESYNKSEADFFRRYAAPKVVVTGRKDSSHLSTENYPAINITWKAAIAYCDWLTEQYNSSDKKKKFKAVKFRLPTRDEWQIAALGDENFQSWKYEENVVEMTVAEDTLSMLPRKGKKVKMSVKENILYPWWGSWHYRNKPQNHKNCWLGNFKVVNPAKLCPARNSGYDGWTMMAMVESYFPNNFGLYDMVGNVAEMISEEGLACGGSWNDTPEESTIKSVKTYKASDKTVGFRVFMEVLE
jgi:formylglycine-generating enzyme required for sulfatase activity